MKKTQKKKIFLLFGFLILILALRTQGFSKGENSNIYPSTENLIFTKQIFINTVPNPFEISNFEERILEEINDGSDEDEEPSEEDDEEDDEDSDGVEDDTEEYNLRDIDIEISEDSAQIESKLRSGDIKNKIKIEIEASDKLKIQISFESEIESGEIDLEFTVYFSKIIEFIDTNNDSKYNPSIDTILQEYTLSEFSPINYTKVTQEMGEILHYLRIETEDGIFTAHIFIVEEFLLVNNSLITPSQIKIDIEISDFVYSSNPFSQLALEVELETETEINIEEETEDEELGYGSNEAALNFSTDGYSGFFSWAEQVDVDGEVHNVSITSDLDKEEEKRLYIAYPRGINIYHDPKVGISQILQFNTFVPGTDNFQFIITITIIIISILLFGFGLVMSKSEYRTYLLNRVLFINKGVHRLSMEDVLENEFRSKIINFIIDEPGIHYKNLLRLTETSASNLAWHLDILETYKIIHKQRVGHFLIFYPYLDKNPFAKFNYKIAKSKTTLEIFQIVGDNNGIYQSDLAKRMKLDHKTVKYHLDKLLEADVIFPEKKGRRKLYFARIPASEYFKDDSEEININ